MFALRSLTVAAAGVVLAGCGAAHLGADDMIVAQEHDAATPDLARADLRPAGDMVMATGPERLSQTGLYADFSSRTMAFGVVQYEPRYPLWSDGSDKKRFLLLPPGTKIDTSDMDNWVFPLGTRLWKEFHVGGKLVETRLLQKVWDDPNGWYKIAYLWRVDGTDADATPAGVENASGTTHNVPSQEDCWKCHTSVRDVVIGVSAIQLSKGNGQGDLTRLAAMGLLTNPPVSDFSPPGAGTVQDALGYLHGNCGHCHTEHSWFEHESSLRLRLHVADATPESTEIYKTSIRVKMFHEMPPDIDDGVLPGQPERSQIYMRTALRDEWAMPPICSKVADPAGLALIRSWITSLPP